MSGTHEPAPVRTERDVADALRLRVGPPPVRRLSRGMLIGGASFACLLIAGAVIWNWSGSRRTTPSDELIGAHGTSRPDGLETLPDDYKAPPKLGPPLPGDLGRPILKGQERDADALKANGKAAEEELARAINSGLFVRVEATTDRSANRSNMPGEKVGAADDAKASSADLAANSSDASPYVLQAGSVISAALITGLNSDLPGPVTAQVTENVYDSATGRHLLIPQGARLMGSYENRLAYGQSRILIIWTRLILPDGRTIGLDDMPATDIAGQAGLEDEVDHHWDRVLLAAGLSTVLGIGAELGSNDESDIARAIRDSTQDTIGRTGTDIVRRQLDMAPTITVRAGFPTRVMVTHDLVIEPMGE